MQYICIYKIGDFYMGDLKKKKVDYIVRRPDEENKLISNDTVLTGEQTVETLRAYMKKFYEMQKNKESEE